MTSSSTPPPSTGGPAAVINGRYEIRAQLGSTSWSNDFRARDLLLDRDVVFKALRPELIGDRTFIERFRAQAQAAANLTHPALASVFDWGRDPNGLAQAEAHAATCVSLPCHPQMSDDDARRVAAAVSDFPR